MVTQIFVDAILRNYLERGDVMKRKCKGAVLMIAAVVLLAIITGVVSGMRGGGDEDIFDPANFTDIRQPLTLSEATPHGQIAVEHIEFINDNLYHRFGFSYREMETAKWLVEELLAMGYTWDYIEVQEHAFTDVEFFWIPLLEDTARLMMPIYFFLDQSPFVNFGIRESRQSQNVILTVPGVSDQVIVVGAHYDSVMYPGASDNASGMGLLLESAQRMLNIDNYYTIVYVFFGGEEVGLVGAIYYVGSLSEQEHENILFMINADILFEGPDLFYMAGYDANGQPGSNHITETWDQIAMAMNAQHGITLNPWPEGVFGPSDQLAFLPKGHTAMFMLGLDAPEGWTGEITDMNRVLHSSRDDFHYINETWPGKIDQNMWAFSVFLEELLLATYENSY